MVLNGDGSAGFGYAGGDALVLDDVGFSFPGSHAVLNGDGEVLGAAHLRFGKFGADIALNLGIGQGSLLYS